MLSLRCFLPALLLLAAPLAQAGELPIPSLMRLLTTEFGPEVASRLLGASSALIEEEAESRLTRLLREKCGLVSEEGIRGLSAAQSRALARGAYEILSVGRLEFLPLAETTNFSTTARRFVGRWSIPPLTIGSSVAEIAQGNRFLNTLTDPIVLQGPPESRALQRAGILLEGGGDGVALLDASGKTLRISPSSTGNGGSRAVYDGVEYIEFPNSTMLQSVDPVTGKPRSFLVSRGVRTYATDVDLATGKINPKGYISDVLLFEVVEGKAVYRSRLLKSVEGTQFFFEDPRISVLHTSDGSSRTFLSGTDYSPHIEGSSSPDVMNRYLEVRFDGRGLPQPIETGAGGIPHFSNLSPFPKLRAGGKGILSIDAKNATIALNEQGQVVVRTRLRPDFSAPEVQALAGNQRWKYAEQVFVFENFDEFSRYDWDHCLEDLFAKAPADGTRVKPVTAKVILKDSQLHELFRDPRVASAQGKGAGPGTTPVRVVRRGDMLYVSDGKFAPEHPVGKVPLGFPLQEGEVSYLTFDHEIRYISDVRDGHSFLKRHYSLSIKKFDPSLTKIEAYYADALQPKNPHELGYNSGIVDLQHVYPMGREVLVGASGQARVRISMGVSDAHTEVIFVDLVSLITEMAPGSLRWKSGQIYRP